MDKQEILYNKWIVIKRFQPSGQGESILVKKSDDNNEYVIKILKNRATVNRKRFEQEINILQKCDFSPMLPKVIEVDIENYYYVMEYINGKSLDMSIQDKKNWHDFDKCMNCIMNLLEIVRYYSSLGIIHRDIKPANIICRDNDISQMSLIDFGISYDMNNNENYTMLGEELGNRFLHLPELESGDKRDIRSDITFCVGVFFFLLTGEKPGNLYVDKCKPHEKASAIIKLQWLGSERLKIINEIFDKGFNLDINERFQTVDDLIFALNGLNHRYYLSSKTDKLNSYTLTTMNRSIGQKKTKVEKLLVLEQYNGKDICIGQVKLYDWGDRYHIEVEKSDYLKAFSDKYIQYSSLNDLYLLKQHKIDIKLSEISMADTKFELSNRVHIESDRIYFDNFKLANYLCELPLKKALEPVFYIKVNTGELLDIKSREGELLIYYTTGKIDIYDYKEKSIRSLDTQLTNVDWIELSNGKNWLFSYNDECGIKLFEFNGSRFEQCSMKCLERVYGIIDCMFLSENEMLFILMDRITIVDLINEQETIVVGNTCINGVEYISLNKEFCVVSCGKFIKKRVLINIKKQTCVKLDKYYAIVESSNDELYFLSYNSIIKIDTVTGKEIDSILDFDNRKDVFRGISKSDIKIHQHNFFNMKYLNSSSDYCREISYGSLNRDYSWTMKTDSNIKKLVMYRQGIVTLEESGQLIVWKMNI